MTNFNRDMDSRRRRRRPRHTRGSYALVVPSVLTAGYRGQFCCWIPSNGPEDAITVADLSRGEVF